MKSVASNQHPVARLADRLDDVVVAGLLFEVAHLSDSGRWVVPSVETERRQHAQLRRAVEAAREAAGGIDVFVREPLGSRRGQWGTELKCEFSGLLALAKMMPPDIGDDHLFADWRGALRRVGERARLLRDVDTSASVELGEQWVDADAAAAMFGMTERTWRRHASAQLVPAPIRIGGSVRWDPVELQKWARRGSPPRAQWEKMRVDG
ncbi:MAG: helix-turn-helix domain-containing protein [Planctomycetota bacterium]|nr:helix-turn-helix domain-containing protein [Planctomycetota bacterium]